MAEYRRERSSLWGPRRRRQRERRRTGRKIAHRTGKDRENEGRKEKKQQTGIKTVSGRKYSRRVPPHPRGNVCCSIRFENGVPAIVALRGGRGEATTARRRTSENQPHPTVPSIGRRPAPASSNAALKYAYERRSGLDRATNGACFKSDSPRRGETCSRCQQSGKVARYT